MADRFSLEQDLAHARTLAGTAASVLDGAIGKVPDGAPDYRDHLRKARHHLEEAKKQLASALSLAPLRPRVLPTVFGRSRL